MGWKPEKISKELWTYYCLRSEGLIDELPYEYWGPDRNAEENDRIARQKIRLKFEPVKWERCYTGRGVLRKGQKPPWEAPDVVWDPRPPKIPENQRPRFLLDSKKFGRNG